MGPSPPPKNAHFVERTVKTQEKRGEVKGYSKGFRKPKYGGWGGAQLKRGRRGHVRLRSEANRESLVVGNRLGEGVDRKKKTSVGYPMLQRGTDKDKKRAHLWGLLGGRDVQMERRGLTTDRTKLLVSSCHRGKKKGPEK